MAPALDVEVIRDEVLSVVLTLAEDRIPNIRFNVAKALEVLAVRLGTPVAPSISVTPEAIELVKQGIVPALNNLLHDKDADVRFFADKASIIAQNIVNNSGVDGSATLEGQEVIMTDA